MRHKTSRLSTVLSFVLVGMILIVPFFVHKKEQSTPVASRQSPLIAPLSFTKEVSIAGAQLHVAVAANVFSRSRGLSDTASLAPDQGMLFVFTDEQQPAFWMKDMQYPIDIIWIGKDKTVKEVSENFDPASYPKQYIPQSPVQYVLEVPAGFVKAHKITIGRNVEF